MAAPIALQEDFDAVQLRALARSSADPGQVCRLLALAAIYDSGTRSAASGCRRCATGFCGSMPRVRRALSPARRRATGRFSTRSGG